MVAMDLKSWDSAYTDANGIFTNRKKLPVTTHMYFQYDIDGRTPLFMA